MNNLPSDLPAIISAKKAGEILKIHNDQDLYETLEKENFAYQEDDGCCWKVLTKRLDEYIDSQLNQ